MTPPVLVADFDFTRRYVIAHVLRKAGHEVVELGDDVSREHARESVLPTGTTELVINLREDQTRVYAGQGCERMPGAIVAGAHARPFVIDTAEQSAVIGVHFQPGGAVPFLGVDAGSL